MREWENEIQGKNFKAARFTPKVSKPQRHASDVIEQWKQRRKKRFSFGCSLFQRSPTESESRTKDLAIPYTTCCVSSSYCTPGKQILSVPYPLCLTLLGYICWSRRTIPEILSFWPMGIPWVPEHLWVEGTNVFFFMSRWVSRSNWIYYLFFGFVSKYKH